MGPIQDAASLLDAIASRSDRLTDLEARARIYLRIDGVKQKGSAVIFYRMPNLLKLDISDSFLGIGVLSALAVSDSLMVYLPRDNRFISGLPEEVLYRLTGVNLAYYSATRAILGLPTLSPTILPRVDRFETRGDRIFLQILEPLWTRQVWVDRGTATLQEERIYTPQGILLSTRRLSDYRNEDGVILPRSFEIIQGDDRIEFHITKRRINKGVADDRFRMKVPSDYRSFQDEGNP